MPTPHRPLALVLAILVLAGLPLTGAMAAEPAPHAPPHVSKGGGAVAAQPNHPLQHAAIPTRPAGPLDTPSHPAIHPDRQLVEAVALAGSRLVAVGAGGLLILSDDNGITWRQVPMPVSATLTDIRFTDERTGWAVGHAGVVLRTDDAGEHWSVVLDGARAAQVILAAAQDANASDDVRDRAIAAAEVLVHTDPDRPFLLIQARGHDTVRLLGADGMAVESADGGRHWLPWSNAVDDPDRLPFLGLAERDNYALAAGAHGLVLGGLPAAGLHALKSPYDGNLFGVIDGGRYGFVLFGQQGHAYASTDPGPDLAGREVNWHRIAGPTPTALTAGLLRQDGSVLLGDAAGSTWRLAGRPDGPRLEPAHPSAPFPILAMAEAADRSVILAGPGGMLRVGPEPATVPAVPTPGPASTAAQPPAAPVVTPAHPTAGPSPPSRP